MDKLLKNKVALITGAGSGIGKSAALLLADNGASIVVADINEEHGKKVVEEIKGKGGKAIFVMVDTSKPSDAEKSVAEAVKAFGKLDIAVNNAGIGGPAAPIGEYDIEGWNKVIAVNLSGVFYGMRYQIPAMLKNGGGAIVNMASILGQVGFATSPAYVAAKHGVVGLTKNGALEYAAQGIRVNAVGPGFIKTPLLDDNLSPDVLEFLKTKHPIGRLGEPEEVAQLVLFLASENASFINGSYYAIDGGYLAQ
ncbi:MAG: SDR family oxidoreductase [Imperialibacter sp.]